MIFMGESEDAGYWTVRCSEADYMVEVKNSGDLETKMLSRRGARFALLAAILKGGAGGQT